MLSWLGIFLGGGLGALARSVLSGKIGTHWGIMLINVTGAFLIGVAYYFFIQKANLRPEWKAFAITGLLGGFTTFSTFMLDFGVLMNGQRMLEAFLYLLGSVLLGIGALYVGVLIGRSCF